MPNIRCFVLPDDGLAPILNTINQAQTSLDIYFFRSENPAIEQAIFAAVQRGVQVRGLLDTNYDTAPDAYKRLSKGGVDLQWAAPYFVKTHAKSLLADRQTAYISTANFVTDWQGLRDYTIITDEQAVVAAWEAVFAADWARQEDKPSAEQVSSLVLSPSNSRTAVLDFIKQAQTSLYLQHEQFSDEQVMRAVAERANAGVQVQVIAGQKVSAATAQQLAQLAPSVQFSHGGQLRIHAKLLVRDKEAILVGSLNLTDESLDRRREISLVVNDNAAVARALATFEADFAANGAGELAQT